MRESLLGVVAAVMVLLAFPFLLLGFARYVAWVCSLFHVGGM